MVELDSALPELARLGKGVGRGGGEARETRARQRWGRTEAGAAAGRWGGVGRRRSEGLVGARI